jgi:hypothetical protein
MTGIDITIDLSLRGGSERSQEQVTRGTGTRRSTRPVLRDDFVIPHVGPTISDEEVLDFAQSVAENILDSPSRAVTAQANQNEEDVKLLTN